MKKVYNKNLWLIIPLVGIIISLVYLIDTGRIANPQAIFHVFHGIIMTSGLWLGCMAIVLYLWKKYPWEHHPAKHLIIEIPAIVAYTIVFSFAVYFVEAKFGLSHYQDISLFMDAITTILITLFITSIHEAIFFYRQWKYNFSKSVRLEKDHLEAKYEALKSQINPHFLFNSLNSLVSLVEDNEKAVDYIQNLSEFLRYLLKGSNREVVLVREELEMLKKYIQILKIRFGKNLITNINIPEKYYHFSVPPLVLQILTENCIKHNIISQNKPLKISVYAENESITVENVLQRKSIPNTTGQGLKNITERYRFFTTREVRIKETIGTFAVTIPLIKVDL
jgi:two-component system LytT family sensor kinase